MATKAQISANRVNARKSTGPRSAAGRIRSSRNSYRHGLSAALQSSGERQTHVEELARKIADNISDEVTLELARTAAICEIDLRRIRAAKVAAIKRMLKFGPYDALNVNTNPRGGKDPRVCQQLTRSEWLKRCDGRYRT